MHDGAAIGTDGDAPPPLCAPRRRQQAARMELHLAGRLHSIGEPGPYAVGEGLPRRRDMRRHVCIGHWRHLERGRLIVDRHWQLASELASPFAASGALERSEGGERSTAQLEPLELSELRELPALDHKARAAFIRPRATEPPRAVRTVVESRVEGRIAPDQL